MNNHSSTFFDDFTKTLRVLDSCRTRQQISVAEKYFQTLLVKWQNKMCDKTIGLFTENFSDKVSVKVNNLYLSHEN